MVHSLSVNHLLKTTGLTHYNRAYIYIENNYTICSITMKKLLIIPLVAVIAMASCKHESFDERCAREAREFTMKQCPQQIDKDLILDSMVYSGNEKTGKDRCFSYYYTFKGMQDSLLNKMITEYPDTARRRLDDFKKSLLNSLANSVQMKPYKDKGFDFEYVYYSTKKKGVILQFRFTKADYQH